MKQLILSLLGLLFLVACSDPEAVAGEDPAGAFNIQVVAKFDQPWAMTFLPNGQLLITEKPGNLLRVTQSGEKSTISGLPEVDEGGQGGLGDVILHPDFAHNGLLYLSYAEAGNSDVRGAAVIRARLNINESQLEDAQVIWRQVPKVTGRGHYGHRLAFDPDGYLYISSGEREKFTPAQDMQSNLGKIIRVTDTGDIPPDNPFVAMGGVAAQVWSLGHRNPLGLAFDSSGQLWSHEMGPRGGDELNLVIKGANYGYPEVSNGKHYNGTEIPDHFTRPEFNAPKTWWTPVISPAGFIIYKGALFPQWQGQGFIGGLSSQSLIRVELSKSTARELQRFHFGNRIREIEQGSDGAIWMLEDGRNGRLLKLTPAQKPESRAKKKNGKERDRGEVAE